MAASKMKQPNTWEIKGSKCVIYTQRISSTTFFFSPADGKRTRLGLIWFGSACMVVIITANFIPFFSL